MKLLLKKSYKTKKSIKVCNKKIKKWKRIFLKNKHGKIIQENEKRVLKLYQSLACKFIIRYGLVYYQVRNLESSKIMKKWESITLKKSKPIRNRKY